MAATGGNLLDYGLAINFFGNYRQEGSAVNTIASQLTTTLGTLRNMVIGGGIAASIYSFSNSILTYAKSMEQNFANLKSTLGGTTKALETMEWARIKGATTPFEIEEVNSAVGTMTTMGFNKNDDMREEVFQSVGDFAALRGFDFADMMQRVSKATFGNWESLGDQFGIRKQTIGGMAREQMSRTPDKFTGQEAAIEKAIKMVEKGKVGSEEYKMSVIKLMGVLGSGGMINRLETIAGAWSNVNDLTSNFMMSLVGYSQIQGSLANAIKTTITDKILKPFTTLHTITKNGVEITTDSVVQLGRIGAGVGKLLAQVWRIFDTQVGNASQGIVNWIDKIDIFFSNFKDNIAPIILFIAIVKIQIEAFLRGFIDAFSTSFGFFLRLGLGVWKMVMGLAKWLGIGKTDAEAFGLVLGTILGTLLGIKAFKMIVSPFVSIFGDMLKFRDTLIATKALISVGEGWSLKDSIGFRWALMVENIGKIKIGLRAATIASWQFLVSVAMNPITWIVAAVILLVAWIVYLVLNWDEVQKKMQGVSDSALVMLTLFLPLVGLPLLMAKYWKELKSIAMNMWFTVKWKAIEFWLYVKYEIFKPMQDWWSRIKNNASETWANIKIAAGLFWDYLALKFPWLNKVSEKFKSVWADVSNFFREISASITNIWKMFTDSSFIKTLTSLKIFSEESAANTQKNMQEAGLKYGEPELVAQMNSEKAAIEAETKRLYAPPPDKDKKEGSNTKVVHNYSGMSIHLPQVKHGHQFTGSLQEHLKNQQKAGK